MCTLHESSRSSQMGETACLGPIWAGFCSEIRRAGTRLQEEAVQSLCGELLQLKSGSAESILVLNTLPWERTEVISRTGTAGTEALGSSNSEVARASGFLTVSEAASEELLCLSLSWRGFTDLSKCFLGLIPLQVVSD